MSREPFPGFPARSGLTPLPDMFFSQVLPGAESLPELKVLLHLFWRLYHRKASQRFVTFDELSADGVLMQGLAGDGRPEDTLRAALQSAVDHGLLLRATVQSVPEPRDLYFINSVADQEALSRLEAGDVSAPAPRAGPATPKPEPPNIFVLYEQNIGLMTPMIAEELKEAEKTYPAAWIDEAFREAVRLNKRNWKYISRILERWATEGKGHGEPGRDTGRKGSPGRYFTGKYGHLVRK